ncbi:FG-GAP repeat protein [Streptomyces acidiscabies]|nr:FG-GAP repeat protein [Streptomyces acidiscabies]GAV46152.1 FG-GAP repeat protein [Streptomyces acidiscabies]
MLALRSDGDPERDAKPPAAARPLDENAAQLKARQTGRKVEVAALHDEFSTTVANPDGTFTYTTSVAPVRAKNSAGQWAPVDTTLRREGDGWRTVNSPYPVTFTDGDREAEGSTARKAAFRAEDTPWNHLLTMTADGHDITFEWPGELPAPVVEDNRTLYEGVLPGVDLMLSARDTGFTHVLIVHTPEAAAQLAATPPRYRVTSPTLSFSLDPATDVLLAKDDAGQEIAVSPTPFLWDSAGTHDTDTPAADPDAATGTNEDREAVEEGYTPAPAPDDTEPPSADAHGDDPGEVPDADFTIEPSLAPSAGQDAGTVPGEEGIDPAAYAVPAAAHETLALPAAGGPGEGAHATTAAASFDTGVLTVSPPSSYLVSTEGLTYPLFLDPSTTGIRANWTTVYKKYPGSSFYDGANYNEDTKEARVGFERDTWGTARSFFKMRLRTAIKGATVSAANLKVLETHSWSCSKRTVQLWRTDGFGTRTTWNNQPAWKRKITSKSFAYGWKSNSACPDAYVNFTVTSLLQEAADNGWTEFNLGMVASNSSTAPTSSAGGLETDTYSWKKFQAEGAGSPVLAVTYNRRPGAPTNYTMTPGGCDTSSAPYIKLGKTVPTISAKAVDPDGDLAKLEFEVTRSDTGAKTTYNRAADDGEVAGASLTGLVNKVTYAWRVRAWDAATSSGWTPTCRFTYDTDLPDSPAPVVSTDFPGDNDNDGDGETWSKNPFGTAGSFTFAVGDTSETDIVKFVWSINSTNYAGYVCANGKQGTSGGTTVSCTTALKSATVTGVMPPAAGPNTLYVKAVDAAGNMSPAARIHTFYVKPRSTPDSPGDLNGDGTADFAHISDVGNLWIGALSQNGTWFNQTYAAHDQGKILRDAATVPHIWNGQGTFSLVTHNGDFAHGDGVTDWVIRTPEGRLFVYPGDGYGGIDVSRRIQVRLPANAPHPSTFSEIKSAGDVTGDGRPELFVAGGAGGAELWVFTGYTGVTFTEAIQLTTGAWADRDFVAIADYNGDGAADMTYRVRTGTAAGNIYLRKGILDSDGVGTVLKSLGTSADSLDGDDYYVTPGTFTAADFPLLYGSPDITKDGIPDIVATNSAGALLLYKGGATTIGAATTLRASLFATTKQLG